MSSQEEKRPVNTERQLGLLRRINDITNSIIYGTDPNHERENQRDMESIEAVINRVNNRYRGVTGEDVLEFLNRSIYEQNKNLRKNIRNTRKIKLNDLIEDPDNAIINDIFFMEGDRFSLYRNYELIYEHITQLAQALEAYVDNIISPDDFTKDIFNIFFEDQRVEEKDRGGNNVKSRIAKLNEIYNIEDKAQNIIRNTLKLGDQFVAVLRLDEEFNMMLSEDDQVRGGDIFDLTDDKKVKQKEYILSESDIPDLNDEQLEALNEFFLEHQRDKKEKKKLNAYEWRSKIIESINKNVIVNENPLNLFEDGLELLKEYKLKHLQENLHDIPSHIGSGQEEITDNPFVEPMGKNAKPLKMPGSVMQILEPERVIKLSFNGIEYGYYYIEKLEDDTFGLMASADRNFMTETPTDYISNRKDLKTELIVNLFANAIGKKLNREFIAKNPEFKRILHGLIKQGYIASKRIKITYLAPNEVVHFKTGGEEYGESIYKKVLFTAKLYLAALTTTLLKQITRAHDRRVFYIEVGLDDDMEGVVQSFVRDIKTRELKMGDLTKDVDTVINSMGQFHDIFIPVINGDKPVEIDEQRGSDVQIENDFLEYLRKSMMSAMGVPSAFLNYSEEVQFARSLAMENGRFVRSIIALQKSFGTAFTKLYRLLYVNEYDGIDKNAYETSESIEVKFPPPSSLNMTNISEQIRSSGEVIEFVLNTLMGEDNSNDNKQRLYARKAIAKKLIPSIDWDEYEEIIEKALIDDKEEQLINGEGEDDQGW